VTAPRFCARFKLRGRAAEATFADVARWVLDASGVEIPVELLRFEVYRNKRGGLSCQGRLSYRGPLRRGGDLQRVKLDLTIDEKVVLPPVERPVGHPYSDRPQSGMIALCYAFEELLAHKGPDGWVCSGRTGVHVDTRYGTSRAHDRKL
jgi:hypothetical protein